ncbi:MAG: hypothetical protein EAZ89_09960 [Bacteroidetes bacterium]|nr:MAG: hypothetical protein EAZ89_09960 [Bacteroidota bacterium]
MSGIQLSDHADFQELLRKFPDYPHLIRYLKQQGYGTYRLKTFAKQEGSSDASYEDQERFYGFDTWVQHPDIPYQGYKYDFHGGIPDQYGLGYFLDDVPRDRSKPEFLFFISMASHWPFFPPPPLTKNWRQLDSIRTDPYKIPIPDSLTTEYDRYMWRAEGKMAPRYAKAIFYDLRMMTQFTMEQVSPGSIVIIIGDHQPPGVTAYGQDGLECPVHILSQDSLFLQSLDAYGFRRGMEADTVLPAPLRHQGLYSLLVRELNRRYGSDPEKLPPYLPEGL